MSLINVSSSCAHTRTERTGTSRVCVDCGMVMDRFTELRSGGDAGVFETTFRPQFLTYNDEQNSIPRHLHQTHRSVPRSFIDSSSKYMRAQRRAHRTALAKAGRTTISMACRKRVQVEAMKLSRCLSLSAPVHRQLMKVIIAAYEHRWQTMQAPELLAGSLAYWVCRRNNQPIVMREVAAAVGVDPVRFGRFYLLVMRVMNLERCSTLPEAFVERVVSLLPNFRRDDPAIVNLLENVNTVMDTPECEALVDGRFPQALAIAAVLICYQEVVDQSRPLNYGIPVPLSTSSGSDESSADDEANGNINDSDEEKNSVSPGTRRRTTSSTSSVPSSRNANNHTALRSRKRFIRRWLASQLHVKVATVLKRERELRESLRAMAKQHLPWAKNIKYYSIDAHVPALLQHLRFLKQLPGTDGHSETEEESSPQADPAELQELDGCTSSDSGAESDDTLDCRPPPDSAGGTRSFDRRSVNLGSVDTSSVAMGTVDRRTADTAPVRVPSPSRVSPGERSSAPAQQSASQRQQPTVAPATSSALEQLDTKPFLIESRCLPPALVRLRRTQLQNAARSLAASERLAVLRKMSSEHGTAPSLPFHSGKEEEEHQQQQQQQQQQQGGGGMYGMQQQQQRQQQQQQQSHRGGFGGAGGGYGSFARSQAGGGQSVFTGGFGSGGVPQSQAASASVAGKQHLFSLGPPPVNSSSALSAGGTTLGGGIRAAAPSTSSSLTAAASSATSAVTPGGLAGGTTTSDEQLWMAETFTFRGIPENAPDMKYCIRT